MLKQKITSLVFLAALMVHGAVLADSFRHEDNARRNAAKRARLAEMPALIDARLDAANTLPEFREAVREILKRMAANIEAVR